jgi:tRNA A37 threonylcarbamoyladenosine modification protein TsaB
VNPLHRPGPADHGAGKVDAFAAALTEMDGTIWLAGEIGADLRDAVADLGHVRAVDNNIALRRAGQLAHLAAQHLAAGHADDLATFQPLYLQSP